jgi:hypothetical protein
MICWATLWGTRGSPKPSASRSSAREKMGRMSGANQRAIVTISADVTATSAITIPRTPIRAAITSSSRATIVPAERENDSATNWPDRSPMRST